MLKQSRTSISQARKIAGPHTEGDATDLILYFCLVVSTASPGCPAEQLAGVQTGKQIFGMIGGATVTFMFGYHLALPSNVAQPASDLLLGFC
jgi:hypothetical protein